MCNRLFLFAHIIASSIKHKHTVINPAFFEYASFFQSTGQDIFCRYPAQKSLFKNHKTIGRPLYYITYLISQLLFFLGRLGFQFKTLKTIRFTQAHQADKPYFDLDNNSFLENKLGDNQIIFFQGWYLRGDKSLSDHADKVRKYFTPLETYQCRIKNLISHLRQDCDILRGIVIRHGDYRKYLGGKYFYGLNNYVNYMEEIETLFPDKKLKFLICSDEDQNTTAFKKFDYYFRSKHMIENLYSLAACHYILSPPSTYGMWASFYGKVPLCIVENPEQPISIDNFKVIIC